MSRPATQQELSKEQILELVIPTTPKTFKLSRGVDRFIPRGEELKEGQTAKATEVTLRPLRWSDLAPLPLELGRLDRGDLSDLAARAAGEHPKTFDQMVLRDVGQVTDHAAKGLAALNRALIGGDGDEAPALHAGDKPVRIPIKTEKAKRHGEKLEELDFPTLLAGHVRGYPIDAQELSFGDCLTMVGRATGLTDGELGRLELEDVGAIVGVLLGFLLELQGT